MRHLDLPVKNYIRADIFEDIISENNKKYGSGKNSFLTLDITSDDLPKVDIIFCRDCLPHLPNESIIAALKQIKKANQNTFLLRPMSA
jgi:hypothetical protein